MFSHACYIFPIPCLASYPGSPLRARNNWWPLYRVEKRLILTGTKVINYCVCARGRTWVRGYTLFTSESCTCDGFLYILYMYMHTVHVYTHDSIYTGTCTCMYTYQYLYTGITVCTCTHTRTHKNNHVHSGLQFTEREQRREKEKPHAINKVKFTKALWLRKILFNILVNSLSGLENTCIYLQQPQQLRICSYIIWVYLYIPGTPVIHQNHSKNVFLSLWHGNRLTHGIAWAYEV